MAARARRGDRCALALDRQPTPPLRKRRRPSTQCVSVRTRPHPIIVASARQLLRHPHVELAKGADHPTHDGLVGHEDCPRGPGKVQEIVSCPPRWDNGNSEVWHTSSALTELPPVTMPESTFVRWPLQRRSVIQTVVTNRPPALLGRCLYICLVAGYPHLAR